MCCSLGLKSYWKLDFLDLMTYLIQGILEQVKQFNYLGCKLSLDRELDFDKKINRFQSICGTIRKNLKKTRTDTQIKF
jgi:hypothetical protein